MKIERNFQVIEAPRGRPFGGGAGHHNGIATSRNYRDCVIFMGNPKISINCESPIIGGDSARPPEPPLRFTMMSYYSHGNYRSRGVATAAGAEAFRAVAPKSVEKNIVRNSIKLKNVNL